MSDGRSRERRSSPELIGAASVVLITLAAFCLVLVVLLAVSPLWELPDSACRNALSPDDGNAGCSAVASRRRQWIAWVLLVALLSIVAVVFVRRRARPRSAEPLRPIAIALMALATLVATAGAAFLTVGRNHEMCGSTLSRVDPFGVYAPGRPQECAPSYAASRTDAWVLGLFALAALAAAVAAQTRGMTSARGGAVTPSADEP